MKPPERHGNREDRVGEPRLSLMEVVKLVAPYVAAVGASVEMINGLLRIIG